MAGHTKPNKKPVAPGASSRNGVDPPRTPVMTSPVGPRSIPAELIRVRAYEIYLSRRGAPGDPVSDWLRAERELLAEKGRIVEAKVEPRGETMLHDPE